MSQPDKAIATPQGANNKGRQDGSSSLSKKERGRLKKLQNRAACLNENGSLSGIAADADWKELQRLHQEQHGPAAPPYSVPVHVRWKGGEPRANIEAASHRELLLRFVRTITDAATTGPHSGSEKNRKRASGADFEASGGSFGWACLHNPAAVSNVAVVEIGVETCEAADRLRSRIFDALAVVGERSVVSVSTKWFQDSQKQPQSVSCALMYNKADPKKDDKSRKKRTESASVTMDGLDALLEPLLLTPEQLEREGYPRSKGSATSTELEQKLQTFRSEREKFVRPQDIPLEEACALVQDFQTQTETKSDAPEEQLQPFVMAPSKPLDSTGSRPHQRRIFAVDCEMVETNQGSELARVTLCHLKSLGDGGTTGIETDVVFDALVRPRNTVLNYLTQYSGMTAAILGNKDDPNIVQLEQVQAALLATIRPDDIVVGHSLENDLRASRWIHATVIDTALLFRPKNGPSKFSLRHLAASLLKKQIQKSDGPHCSEEDAVTALQLAVGRAVQGPSFNFFERPSPTNWMAEVSKKATAVCVGPSAWLRRHVLSTSNAVHALQCESVHDGNGKAVASWLAGPKRRASIVWAKLGLRAAPTDPGLVRQEDADRLDELLKDLLAKLPPRAILVVAIQPGFERADRLSQSRRIRQDPRATVPWSEQEEEEWRQAVRACQSGFVLWVGGSENSS